MYALHPATDRASWNRALACLAGAVLFFMSLSADPAWAQNPRLISDLNQGSASSNPDGWLDFKGRKFFVATTHIVGREIHTTDGTGAGTHALDLYPGPQGSDPADLQACDDEIYFTAISPQTNAREIHRSDGTLSGTQRIPRPAGVNEPVALFAMLGRLFFTTFAGPGFSDLYVTDGTAAGTVRLGPGPLGALFAVSGKVVYTSRDAATGVELWQSDGTPAGTSILKDINPGMGSSAPTNFLLVLGVLYFSASDGVHGNELWRTDGTQGGTVLVKDIRAGSTGSSPGNLTAFRDGVAFTADDGIHGREIWWTDGTATGTALFMDVNPGPLGSRTNTPGRMGVIFGVGLLFHATSPLGTGLHASDGTVAGTILLSLVRIEGEFFQAGVDRVMFLGLFAMRYEPWTSDGTAAGTFRIAELDPNMGSDPRSFATLRGGILFSATTSQYGREPYHYNAGALSHRVGRGSVPRGRAQLTPVPELDATAPRIGSSFTLLGRRAQVGSARAVVLGLPRHDGGVLLMGCLMHFEQSSYLVLPAEAVLAAAWAMTIPIPNNASFDRVGLIAQAIYATTEGLTTSNASWLQFGR